MSRLITPSPGEAIDRLTILNLKITAAEKSNNESAKSNFSIERESIQLYLNDKHYIIPNELTDELQKINARLWNLEDSQRTIIKDVESQFVKEQSQFLDEFVANAILVIRLNDARAETVKKINEACNVHQQEKLYATN